MENASAEVSHPIEIRWADLDPNGHVRHSVYYDWGAMVRLAFLERKGVGVAWMGSRAVGPVIFREEARFRKELRFVDQVHMDMRLAGASADGRKWRIRHRLVRGADEAAIIEVDGAWLDLRARKIVVPPSELIQAFADAVRSEDFADLPSSKDRPG
jgi:acyl-CoA thioester hydrolase